MTPAAFFQLVMGDPWFAWLRILSEFIVIVDERLAEKDAPITAGLSTPDSPQHEHLVVPPSQ